MKASQSHIEPKRRALEAAQHLPSYIPPEPSRKKIPEIPIPKRLSSTIKRHTVSKGTSAAVIQRTTVNAWYVGKIDQRHASRQTCRTPIIIQQASHYPLREKDSAAKASRINPRHTGHNVKLSHVIPATATHPWRGLESSHRHQVATLSTGSYSSCRGESRRWRTMVEGGSIEVAGRRIAPVERNK